MSNTNPSREGLTGKKFFRFLSLPFQPSRLSTFLSLRCVEEVPIDLLIEKGIKGVLLDADGTLGPHHVREYDTGVLGHVQKMVAKGLKVAIYTNAFEDRFQSFEEIGVKIVKNVPPKPDPAGFVIAMAVVMIIAQAIF